MTTKNITIEFINGDTLTYKSDIVFVMLESLRIFIGEQMGIYHFDLIDTRGRNILVGTRDTTLTCIITNREECIECQFTTAYCYLYKGMCSDCYLKLIDIDNNEYKSSDNDRLVITYDKHIVLESNVPNIFKDQIINKL